MKKVLEQLHVVPKVQTIAAIAIAENGTTTAWKAWRGMANTLHQSSEMSVGFGHIDTMAENRTSQFMRRTTSAQHDVQELNLYTYAVYIYRYIRIYIYVYMLILLT